MTTRNKIIDSYCPKCESMTEHERRGRFVTCQACAFTHPVVRLRLVCSWCATVMDDGTPGQPTTHGICPACSEKLEQQIEEDDDDDLDR